jgi:hypothetical protein
MSIREISRRTGLARNTIKKHLRSEESEPKYPRRVSSSKLDPYAEKLATWLDIEATKSRKQRRTLRQIHTDSTQKGENQELIHTVSTFCSQRVWVKIRWKTRVRLQRNSTTGTPPEIAFAVLHCTIGDALIAAVSLTVSVLILWAMDWPNGKFRQVAAATFLMGLAYTIYSEWHNTTVTLSWAYSPAMPTLFGTGLSPVVQWMVIPVIALWWVFLTRP